MIIRKAAEATADEWDDPVEKVNAAKGRKKTDALAVVVNELVMTSSTAPTPFALVLSGGGARGFAHVGVLRALEARGLRPAAVVGVSMGAVVATTYALRDDWYSALLAMDTRAFPRPFRTVAGGRPPLRVRIGRLFDYGRAMREMFLGWGIGTHALFAGTRLLRQLTLGRNLEDGRVPVAVCATDLRAGVRVVFRSGSASAAAYASSALAGVLPPLRRGDQLLCDGVYADLAPIDVARSFGHPAVVAVDAGQALVSEVRNGYQALTRAVEICLMTHAHIRFQEADLVLAPTFARTIDTLDFSARRECVAAGIRAVRRNDAALRQLLGQTGSRLASQRLESGT
jgi:NTE family protein